MKSKQTKMQAQKKLVAAVQKERNETVLKVTLDYMDNHDVVCGIMALRECYRQWRNIEKSKVLDQEIKPIVKFLTELVKADFKIVDMAGSRLNKLIKQEKEQRSQKAQSETNQNKEQA
jgi:hypothetical protein